jgi:tripartite-type tricarboxylate transporter receptor subunit TctC
MAHAIPAQGLRRPISLVIAPVAAILLIAGGAHAQSVADFYKGKQVSIYIGSEAGSGFDAYARLVARHIGKHIPGNPLVVPANKPGAGSLNMTNSLVTLGPKDGTVIGAPQSSAAVEQLLHLLSRGGTAAKYDATKLHWLGSASQDTFVLFDWHSAKPKSFADLLSMEMLLASSGPNTDGSLIAIVLNKVFGTKIKLITGYQASGAGLLAMERGEIDSNAMAYASVATMRPDWIKDQKIRFLAQMGMKPHPELKGVPFVLDLAKTPEDRSVLELVFAKYQMGRPYFVPPEVPQDRVEALRAAFDATMSDPDLQADASKSRIEINPVTGAEVQVMVEGLYRTPEALARRTREILGTE